MDLLRVAWRHIEASERLIAQTRLNATDRAVVEGLLILALEHAEKSKAAIEHAAKLSRVQTPG
ncbi:MAG: hypothetical protein JWM21_2100 [Acidobacteria bacterium]|nr:hypothetical protein [Acidobacteriota bacterium]